VLVVGGGGAGGSRHAGGGGGGGVLFRTGVAFQPNEAVTGQVGAGGLGIAGPGPGNSGGNSQLGLLLAVGEAPCRSRSRLFLECSVEGFLCNFFFIFCKDPSVLQID
jgi:hypothetical protein